MFSSKNFTESGLAFRFLICSELFLCMVLAVVQLLSHVRLFVTHGLEQPGFPVLHCLPEFVQTRVHRVGDAIQPSRPLSFPPSPAFNRSQHQGLFKWVGSLHQVANVLELQCQSFNEYSGLISFSIDWFDLFAAQMTLKSPLQHHSLKASILRCSDFFIRKIHF